VANDRYEWRTGTRQPPRYDLGGLAPDIYLQHGRTAIARHATEVPERLMQRIGVFSPEWDEDELVNGE
jgi:hypothetical protein